MRTLSMLLVCAAVTLAADDAAGQTGAADTLYVKPAIRTRLEALRATTNTLLVVGYEDAGSIGTSVVRDGTVDLDVISLYSAAGERASGVRVAMKSDAGHADTAFVDADEIPGLLTATDSLLAVADSGRTPLRYTEMHYFTRGGLELAAYTYPSSNGKGPPIIEYKIRVDRTYRLTRGIDRKEIMSIRQWFQTAKDRLASLPGR